ncbi:hypothetical protein GEMRC1_005284 [Eukaryota sp. GEM-RC1]
MSDNPLVLQVPTVNYNASDDSDSDWNLDSPITPSATYLEPNSFLQGLIIGVDSDEDTNLTNLLSSSFKLPSFPTSEAKLSDTSLVPEDYDIYSSSLAFLTSLSPYFFSPKTSPSLSTSSLSKPSTTCRSEPQPPSNSLSDKLLPLLLDNSLHKVHQIAMSRTFGEYNFTRVLSF